MIIGITGTLGAGKGTVVEYLKQKGFKHYSARTFFIEELNRRGLPIIRDTMTDVADDLRRIHGPEYFAKESIRRIAEEGVQNAVVESIRAIGEAEYIKSHGGVMWAVDADIAVRYQRISKRMSETDKVSFEKFVADEQREFANTETTKGNLKGVIAMSDAVFTNNGTPEELFAQVEAALTKSV